MKLVLSVALDGGLVGLLATGSRADDIDIYRNSVGAGGGPARAAPLSDRVAAGRARGARGRCSARGAGWRAHLAAHSGCGMLARPRRPRCPAA